MSAPEVRIDQLTGGRVLIAPGRAARPDQFRSGAWRGGALGTCQFCEGSEAETPPEVDADRSGGSGPDRPGWRTRTVPNLYPAAIPADRSGSAEGQDDSPSSSAFSSPADPLLASSRAGEPDMFASRPAVGAHEVIINTPRHVGSLGELEPDELEAAVAAWRRRMLAHADEAYVQLVLNQGPAAGATVEHSHAQLGALNLVPAAVARERERFNSYRELTAGSSLLGEVLREEIRRGERLVAIDDEVALVCPWASRFPYEMRLIPRRPHPSFERDTGGAEMLGRAVAALESALGRPSQFNIWVKTAPRGVEHFHWHLDLAPALEPRASFEMATGIEINNSSPEAAAAELREKIA